MLIVVIQLIGVRRGTGVLSGAIILSRNVQGHRRGCIVVGAMLSTAITV